MKKISAIALTLAILTALTGCLGGYDFNVNPKQGGTHTDLEGVYITIESVEAKDGKKLLHTLWHNETDRDVIYGKGYNVEYLDGEEWKNVQTADFAVIEIACILSPGASNEEIYSLEYFNLSEYGTYRLRSQFWLGDGVSYSVWTEFSVDPIE